MNVPAEPKSWLPPKSPDKWWVRRDEAWRNHETLGFHWGCRWSEPTCYERDGWQGWIVRKELQYKDLCSCVNQTICIPPLIKTGIGNLYWTWGPSKDQSFYSGEMRIPSQIAWAIKSLICKGPRFEIALPSDVEQMTIGPYFSYTVKIGKRKILANWPLYDWMLTEIFDSFGIRWLYPSRSTGSSRWWIGSNSSRGSLNGSHTLYADTGHTACPFAPIRTRICLHSSYLTLLSKKESPSTRRRLSFFCSTRSEWQRPTPFTQRRSYDIRMVVNRQPCASPGVRASIHAWYGPRSLFSTSLCYSLPELKGRWEHLNSMRSCKPGICTRLLSNFHWVHLRKGFMNFL